MTTTDKKSSAFPGFHYFKGQPFLANTSSNHLERLREWPLHEDDIIVATYPKCGTVWTETTVAAILNADDLDRFAEEGPQFVRAPFEFDVVFENEICKQDRPTQFHTHVRYDLLPKDVDTKQVKVINVMRNPKDVAVSYYYHSLMERNFAYDGSWDDFFERFLTGELPWGSWFDYNRSWVQYFNRPNVLHIKYEDYQADRHGMIRRLARFIKRQLTDEQVQRIAEVNSITSMRKREHLDIQHSCLDQTKGRFLRKGEVGDWKNHFSEEQSATMDKMYKTFSEETGLTFTFE